MQPDRPTPEELTQGLPPTSAKIRALGQAGYKRAEIARFLDIDYQHVRNVLVNAGIISGASRAPKCDPPIPTPDVFRRGYLAFREKERRDAMYKTATFLVNHFWGKSADIADSLGVLLLTWNQAFYRYGSFDFQPLEQALAANWQSLESFRRRDILSYTPADDSAIQSLFTQLLDALRICEGKKKGEGSPVAVAKALHLLAPAYFPLWDLRIAQAYRCAYGMQPDVVYLAFARKMKRLIEELAAQGLVLAD